MITGTNKEAGSPGNPPILNLFGLETNEFTQTSGYELIAELMTAGHYF